MSGSQHLGNQQPSSNTWTEPPWSGWIETTGDALLILEAARRGLIPRVTRRLVDSERKMITSGSVFVFDEDESGIKRWTDGFFWSPSRILGNFLLYRETDKRGAGHRGVRADPPPSDVNEQSQYNVDGVKLEGQTLSRPKGDGGQMGLGLDKNRERTLVGSLTNSYKFKPDGLMKKTFSLTIGGVSQHLISYYKVEDVENGRLRSPSSLPELASLDISPEYLDKTHFRNPPKVEIGIDGVPRYRGEADDVETSPTLLPAPLSSGLPLLTDGRVTEGSSSTSKRGKRYDPYGAPLPKRSRKPAKATSAQSQASSSAEQAPEPTAIPAQTAPTGYSDSNAHTTPHPHYSYSAPSYYQVPGYPMQPQPHPHMYPASPYPAGPSPSTSASPPPQQSATSQYSYPAPAAYQSPPNAVDPPQAPHTGAQQPYYPYYPPPPPHGYSGYTPVPWTHYPAYGPTPGSASHHTQTGTTSESGKTNDEAGDSEDT